MVTVENSKFNSNNKKIPRKISLVGTPFPLNFLCGNAVPMRSRPTTPLTIRNKEVDKYASICTRKPITLDLFPILIQWNLKLRLL